MKNLITKYRGWVISGFLAMALSMIISSPQARNISETRLQRLITDREVAQITIVENKKGIRRTYIAEITLTPAASEKYSQLTAGLLSSKEVPHFVCSIGNSREEVNRWKAGLSDQGRIKFSLDNFF